MYIWSTENERQKEKTAGSYRTHLQQTCGRKCVG